MFRQQAIDHISVREHGSVLLTRAFSHTVLTAVSVTILLAIIALFMLFGTTRKAQCQGVLLPTGGVLRVLPNQSGIVQEVRVKDGQVVLAGDVLFVLSSERSSVNGSGAQKTISALPARRRAGATASTVRLCRDKIGTTLQMGNNIAELNINELKLSALVHIKTIFPGLRLANCVKLR